MNSDGHILSAFDRDLETIQALIMKMGGLVEVATLDAARALETRDEDLARLVDVFDVLRREHGKSHEQALQRVCLVLLNSNEFLYVD